jgi:prophage antirepressor-like protein
MNALVDHKAFAAATPAVSLFDFKGHQIRVVMIGGEPWFVARDVGSVLYLLNTTAMLRNITPSEVRDHRLTTHGRPNKIISESALYKVVLRSEQPEAKPFQDWVTKEVLPAIRKDGAYIKGEEKVRSGEMSEEEFVLRAMEIMQGKIARLIRQQHQTP